MLKLDLHTHSLASPDGSITEAQYKKMLEGGLDYIAVTDHNTINFALQLRKALGERIIVGEEIKAIEGEIIGLYLTEEIPARMSALETVKAIKGQGGLVYIPHPFEARRKGLQPKALGAIAEFVDIIEVQNGRAVFENESLKAEAWATRHQVAGAASSDAHGWHGWGKTYSLVDGKVTRSTLTKLLVTSQHKLGWPGARGLLYPKFNRLRKLR